MAIDKVISETFGNHKRIVSKERAFGGDINDSYVLTLDDGTKAFLKTNSVKNAGFFEAECHGLAALKSMKTIGVPEVYVHGVDEEEGFSYLLMEYISPAPRVSGFWETFGYELSSMHSGDVGELTGGKYGFYEDNYIGAGDQSNSMMTSFAEFFRDERLGVQFDRAAGYFDAQMRSKIDRLLGRITDLIPEPDHPSLLHGDLWGGNFVTGSDGKAWLIDPAVYVGSAEADIAMTELFGGFDRRFYRAYFEASGMDVRGYESRRDLYNLYHLTNHLNLFGSSYLGSVVRIVERYAG